MAETLGAGLHRSRAPRRIVSQEEPRGWVYVFGATDGHAVKLGETRQTLRERLDQVNREQMTDDRYCLLVAVRGSKSDETALKKVVGEKLSKRVKKGYRTEYFEPTDALVGWINWLRAMPYAASSLDDQDVAEQPGSDYWLPDGHARCSPVERRWWNANNGDHLFDPEKQFQGPLADTAWNFLRDPTVAYQDYFTDGPIVRAASVAMDGIDYDVASHKMAQRRLLEHFDLGEWAPRDYYTKTRSAFENLWLGNIWLNPPYGENERWFERYLEQAALGYAKQLCMISPVHAFNTKQALPFMRKVAAMVLLSPTPPFFNPGDPSATGTNLPHAVVYCGHRETEFLAAFSDFGIRMRLVLE